MRARLRRLPPYLLGLWTAAILVATHWPRPEMDLSRLGGDKTVHLAAYAVWGMLASAVMPLWQAGRVLGAGALLAALDESTQPLFQRHGDGFDWLADAAGLILGLVAWRLFRALRAVAER